MDGFSRLPRRAQRAGELCRFDAHPRRGHGWRASHRWPECPDDVVINEVSALDGASGEYIELYNYGTATMNLTYFGLYQGETQLSAFDYDTRLEPGAYLVIEGARLTDLLGDGGLGESGTLTLKDESGNFIDASSRAQRASPPLHDFPYSLGA